MKIVPRIKRPAASQTPGLDFVSLVVHSHNSTAGVFQENPVHFTVQETRKQKVIVHFVSLVLQARICAAACVVGDRIRNKKLMQDKRQDILILAQKVGDH